MKPIRVMHFVTGGFSGATQVAIDIIAGHQAYADIDSLLVLRQKKTTTPDKLAKLDTLGIAYQTVGNQSHFSTIKQLQQIIRTWHPDILVAHGFPEHLIGRWAGKGNVPHMVQVEHNSKERYTLFKLWQTRKLSHVTDRVVAVSQGVAQVLAAQGLHAPIISIANGIDPSRFSRQPTSLTQRPKHIIMVARFAKSKDHATLIKALFLLKQKLLRPTLTLVGSGKKSHQQHAAQLIKKYDLALQVTFIPHSSDVPALLDEHQIFVMSSRFEGLNLSVIEGMAAGCVVIGSDAVGVKELIDSGTDGLIFPMADAEQLAKYLEQVLTEPQYYQPMTDIARQKVLNHYTKTRMVNDYYQLFQTLLQNAHDRQ